MHLGGEVLHPHAQTVESQLGHDVHLLERGHPGIRLQSDLGVGEEFEVVGDGPEDLAHLVRGEMGGRAPAPMELEHPAARRKGRRHHGEFLLEVLDVVAHHVLAPGDHHVAAAEVAAVLAEGNVDVEGERILAPAVGRGETLVVLLGAEGVVELGRGGIARVARPRPVVSGEKFAGHLGGRGSVSHVILP